MVTRVDRAVPLPPVDQRPHRLVPVFRHGDQAATRVFPEGRPRLAPGNLFDRVPRPRLPLTPDLGKRRPPEPIAERTKRTTRIDRLELLLVADEHEAYPKETVVAEKFQAMVALGMTNSRMKDFFDLWVLSRDFAFDGSTLVRAMTATFGRRRSAPPTEPPLALAGEFGTDFTKVKQWGAFVRKGKFKAGPAELADVIAILETFLMPPSRASATGETFAATWPPGGPWTHADK